MFAKIRLVIGWALLALLLVFIVVNLEHVEVKFLVGKVVMPKAFIIIGSAAAGAGALWAFRLWKSAHKDQR